MTGCMRTLSPLIRTACGGTGDGTIVLTVPAGDSAGAGVLRGITAAGTIPVIGEAAIGDGIITIITTIRITPATVGAEATGEAATDGMAQTGVTREYMPEDMPTVITRLARDGIVT